MFFAIGGVICHQRPERSFFWDAHQFPVCARCTGLYLSGAVGLLAWLGGRVVSGTSRHPIGRVVSGTGRPTATGRPIGRVVSGTSRPGTALRVLLVAAVPTAVSVATGALGIWDGTNITRAVLAIPLGLCAGAIVAAVITKDLR